jgi:hypothetical protein
VHAVVIAVIFTAYVTLMGVIFWCLAGQLRGSDDDTPGPGMKCDLL